MSADSEFPNGWVALATSSGATVTFTAPAVAGVTHVIDSIDGIIWNAAAATVGSFITLTSSDGQYNENVGILLTSSAVIGAEGTDSVDGPFMAGPGVSLTVTVTGNANTNIMLKIHGHDI